MKETITLESEDLDNIFKYLNCLYSHWEGWSSVTDDDASVAMKRGMDNIQEILGNLNEARGIE